MRLSRLIFGNPIPNKQAEEHTLKKAPALAIFSSDALSSVAYATGEIFTVLLFAGAAALAYSIHIAIFVCILIVVVGVSYRQAIQAYPQGGGAYIVARENLGQRLAILAASALMIDYILTVAVSVSAGVLAITSALPSLQYHAVLISIIFIIILMWMNLRGVKESATAFMWPTYAFVVIILAMVGIGGYHLLFGELNPVVYHHQHHMMQATAGALTLTLILRAFSSGCSAMTGIEAVANGVTAFEKPKAKNAMMTLTILMVLLITMFMGITILAVKLHLDPTANESLLSQLGHQIFGTGFFYYFLQVATCLILLLAANTSFAGFPLLASMISKDGFLPKQLQNVGERLAFSNGIIALSVIAIILIIIFDANTSMLIPLYSLGVFLAFTLCQAGLVRFWFRGREDVKRWWLKAAINGFGSLCTLIAVIVVIESKFTEGAWIVVIAIPALIAWCYIIKRHYDSVDAQLQIDDEDLKEAKEIIQRQPKVLVFVGNMHKGTLSALELAKQMCDDPVAITINTDQEQTDKLLAKWNSVNIPYPLQVIDSQYQSIVGPLLRQIHRMDNTEPERGLTVVMIPKAQTCHWWQSLLHNQRTSILRWGITSMTRQQNKGKARVIIDVPYQLAE